MSLVNIPRDVTDPHYRYRMHTIVTKIEGKGNGVKTVIVNLSTIAIDLDRAPEYITKYFEIEFGSQTNIEGDKYSVNGSNTADKLAQVLDGFINKFVLCKYCKNPETSVIKSSTVAKGLDLKCAACGRRSPLDMKNKLSAYILKNPKSSSGETTSFVGLGEEEGVKEKKSSKEKSSKKSSKEKSSRKSSKKQDSGDDGQTQQEDDDDNVVWSADTSQQSIKERKEKASGGSAAALAMLDLSDKDPVEILKEFYATSPSEDDIMEELSKIQENFSMRSYATARTALEAFSDNTAKGIIDFIKTKVPLLTRIAKRKDGKLGILMGLESICGADETLLKYVVGILQSLYNQDILTEEIIIKWHSSKAKSAVVKQVCIPFIDWLQTAEEEEEEEEVEEEVEEVDA